MTAPPAFCPTCGTRRLPDARFCGGCGADLAVPVVPTPAGGGVGDRRFDRTPAPPSPIPPVAKPQVRRRFRRLWLGIPVLLVVGVVVGVVLLRPSSGRVYQGVFVPTGSLTTARDTTPILLPDARVLVAGGYDVNSKSLASAELYDPRSGTFSPTGSLTTARSTSAILLADGRVLFAGGQGAKGSLASAELYDPRSGTFSPTGSLSTARWAVPILLADGRVLFAGGYDVNSKSLASAELYQ